MEEMYKQALLDAKAVRASAMANAKLSLQEAFEPKINEMIRLKLSEELEEAYEEEDESRAVVNEKSKKGMEDESRALVNEDNEEDEEEMDEASLEEILAELDAMSEEAEEEDESRALVNEEGEEEEEEEEDGEEEESGEETNGAEGEEEVPTDDTKVIDITLGDLKAVLQSIQDSEAGEEATEEMPADETGADDSGEEDIDLDEILANLEEAKMKGNDKKKMEEKKSKEEETKKSLAEAKSIITTLRKELNEVNLLNAKLLYMNKIFKSKNLSESQKVSVVTALDRATNVKEAKNIFEILKESLSSKKSQIQESRGFASKPAGVAPKKPILEADAFVSRWQKIAGIK